MDKNLNRNIFLFLLMLFILSLVLPITMLTKMNNERLERKYHEVVSHFRQFIQLQNSIYSSISSDNIVKASLLQYVLNSDVTLLQKHLNYLKDSFPGVKLLSLYDKSGKLFLSTDYSVMGSMNAYSLFQLNKPVYGIFYMKEYNQYMLSVTAPLYNAFGLGIGYVRLFTTLDAFLEKLSLGDDFALFLSQNGKIVFMAPASLSITDDKVLNELDRPGFKDVFITKKKYISFSAQDSIENIQTIVMIRSFNLLMQILVFVNAILLLLVVYFFIRARIESLRKVEDDKLKGTTDELLGYSQKALHNVYTLSDLVSEMKNEKEDLRNKIRKMDFQQYSGGSTGKKNEFKIISPR